MTYVPNPSERPLAKGIEDFPMVRDSVIQSIERTNMYPILFCPHGWPDLWAVEIKVERRL